MTLLNLVRSSLWLTAAANLAVACAFAWPGSAIGALVGLPTDVHPFYAYFSGAMVALFGCVYAWLASLERPRAEFLLIGAVGKLITVAIAVLLFVNGELAGRTAILISGDLVFAALWLSYLRRSTGTGY